MIGPSETGRFWLCLECRRHVTVRSDKCICGFDRTTVPVRMREVSASEGSAVENRRSLTSVAWPFVVIAALVGVIAYDKLGRPITAGYSEPEPARDAAATPTPIPLSDEVKAALDEAQPQPTTASIQESVPPQQVLRIEIPQQQNDPQAAAPSVDTQNRPLMDA